GYNGYPLNAEVVVVVDAELAALTFLGGDHDHPICTARTVDSASGSILEYRDRLDIRRRQVVELPQGLILNIINHDQRIRRSKRSDTADNNGRSIGSGQSVRLSELHAGKPAVHQLSGIRHRLVYRFLEPRRFNGTRKVRFALFAVSHNHNLIERRNLLLQRYLDVLAIADLHFLHTEADIR